MSTAEITGAYRSTWCDIDTAAFRNNVSLLKQLAGTRMLQVVKANAYGHGLVRMAHEAVAGGAEALGLATIGEAEQLIRSDVKADLYIICGMDPLEIEWCVAHGVHVLAWRKDQFETAALAAEKYKQQPLLELEIDTGMSRSGVLPDECAQLLDSLDAGLLQFVSGMATHFVEADEEDLDLAERQLDEYMSCVDIAHARGMRPLLHVANSPGTLRLPASRLDMIRMGIGGYGLHPSEQARLPVGTQPVLSWRAKVTNVKHVTRGRGISYGWEYVASEDHDIATLAVGYADGFRRKPSGVNTVIVNGVETPVLGRVCMDQCVIRVPDSVGCEVGDVATLIGAQGGVSLSAQQIADRWGTNSYDVVANIRSRVPRNFV